METILVRLMILAAIGQLGLSVLGRTSCESNICVTNIESASRQIVRIDWKPISVFPEEAKRFQEKRR